MSEEFRTLGRRLDGQARRIGTRAGTVLPWAAPFEVLVDHLAALPAPTGGRFERREADVSEVAWPDADWADPVTVSAEPARPGRELPSDVVARLRDVVGPGVETMRVHDDDAAHETAVAHRADAVTVGRDVYFRQGRLNPHEPRGFGLLAHEATHVVERTRPGASWRQATGEASAAEEHLALARETAIVTGRPPALHAWAAPPGPSMVPRAVPGPSAFPGGVPAPASGAAPPSAPVATPAARPMTAATDRPADVPPPPGSQPFDVDALREQIMRDLKRQLRDEYERGG